MGKYLSTHRINKSHIFVGLIWILLWILPWGKSLALDSGPYLKFFVDVLKLGIALGMFILPGALLYILLGRGDDSPFGLCEVLPVGFALSVAIASLIGILGRALGFSFLVVRIIFALSGLGVLALLMLHKPNLDLRRLGLVDSIRGLVTNIPLLLALLLATSVAFNGYQFFIDDTSYGAYLMNWRHSAHLGFFNIVHQMNVAEQSRFWLALYPMGQALLADLSGIPGVLLLSNYLELFLVPLAVVTAYWFARVLGLSRRMAGVSVLVQILFYVLMIDESWPVGFWFFQNMAEDKVSATFLLAPVLFSFILKFLQSPNRNNLTLAFLIGIGLMLTHPVILFLACVVSAGLAGIAWLLGKTDWWKLLQLAVIFILLLLPYVAIRRFDRYSQAIPFDAESVITTFQAERYVNVINDRFYGLNPETLMLLNIPQESGFYPAFQIFRLVPVVLLLFALILALLKIKDGPLYWYVAACILLVAFAAIPYTGWALGYFISARMMSRVAWFSPLGLAGALAIKLILGRPLKRFSSASPKTLESGSKKSDEFAKSVVTGLAAVGILAFSVLLPNVSTYFATLDHNRQLAQVGAFIDQSTDGPTTVIALDYADIQMLPSVSAHASLISFREEKEYNPHNYFMPAEEIRRRMDASNTIRSLDPSIPEDKRCALLDEYQVQFVLAGNGNAEQFTDLTGACRRNFTVSYRTADIILLQSR